MRFLMTALALGLCLIVVLPASADTLRLKNGAELEGTYLGGDVRTIRFMGADGSPKNYVVTDVSAIEFGTTSAPAATTAPAASSTPALTTTRQPDPVAAASADPVTIPEGTVISVRTIDSIDAREAAIGERFRASIDDAVVVDGQTVIPQGADCTVQVMRAETGGRIRGSSELALELYDITISGKTYEVATEYAELKTAGEGKSTARNTAVMAGIGAAIGAIAGGGSGAAIGAAAGGGAGFGASMIKGPHLQVPSETRLSFELRDSLPLI